MKTLLILTLLSVYSSNLFSKTITMQISSLIKMPQASKQKDETSLTKTSFKVKAVLGKEFTLPSNQLKPYKIKLITTKTKSGAIKLTGKIYKIMPDKTELINSATLITRLGVKATIKQSRDSGQSYLFSFKPIKIE